MPSHIYLTMRSLVGYIQYHSVAEFYDVRTTDIAVQSLTETLYLNYLNHFFFDSSLPRDGCFSVVNELSVAVLHHHICPP